MENETLEKRLAQSLEQDSARPEIRWWLAGGSHTDETLMESLEDIRAMGFGGIEVLTMAEEAIDRSRYGWDSPAWYDTTKRLLEKCTEYGMAFSFTSGPNWQPAVPGIDLDSDQAAEELNFSAFKVPAGATVYAPLRPYDLSADGPRYVPRKQHYLKTVAARLAPQSESAEIRLGEKRNVGLFPIPGTEYETVYLVPGSAVDLTELVHPVGEHQFLTWTAPTDGAYVVFSFWYHATAQLAEASFEPAYVINHIHPAGFEAQRDYWDRHFFTPEIQKLIRANGQINFFQDSLEITTSQYSGLYWSSSFMEEFRTRRGYDLTLLLPMVIQYNIGFLTCWITHEAEEKPRYLFEGCEEQRRQLIRDIYQTQTELYMENYLTPIRRWLNSYGIQLRAQTSYGFATVNFEVSDPVDCVDIHETETLEMADEVDYYRTQSGAVHLTGKNIFSAETGATNGGNYYLTPQHYLAKIHKLFIGGVNRVILHGYAAKAGPEGNLQWPGYEALRFDTSERWGSRHPFATDMPKITDYIARTQSLLRTGQQKVDVGILNLAYTSVNVDFWYGAREDYQNHLDELFAWSDRRLNDSGYTYEFFSPNYLLKQIPCKDGLYDAGRTDYRAVIVNQPIMPVNCAKALLKLARQGLPVVLVGDAGTKPAFLAESKAELLDIRQKLCDLKNTASVASQSDAVDGLRALGVWPRVALKKEAPIMLLNRETEDIRLLLAFNPTADTQSVCLGADSLGIPVSYDAWTGTLYDDVCFTQDDRRTWISAELEPNAAALYLIRQGQGRSDRAQSPRRADIKTGPWSLTVESWGPGEKQSEGMGTSRKYIMKPKKRS